MLGRAYKVRRGWGGRPCPYGLINVVFRSGINIKIVGRFLVGCYDPVIIYILFYLSLLQFRVGRETLGLQELRVICLWKFVLLIR